MFQQGKQRKFSDEQHICVGCKKDGECVHQEPMREFYSWRFILTYCASFESKEDTK